ncbi:lytic transglycosylase domain-containing protein [Gordonia phthalatica]|uniref:Murein transglycosylase n=1 Tax=Gordonia phthalatica TaxID=1136941 RepID=A0A0N9NG11_9ACTN|nr:lytic murein transglycosylase [Gordonia phthalatica]ALG86684.1 murein transglycosylase [Gordonia phthalatica]
MTLWRDRPNRVHLSRRGLAVGTATAAIGAVVLGGTVSSVTPASPADLSMAPASVSSVDLAGDRAELAASKTAMTVPAGTATLVGFAPPADPSDPSISDGPAQFRLAANLPSGPLGIPGIVLKAYKLAATRVAAETPQCKLPWFLLAGIGRIESGHAGNGNVDAYGNSRSAIRGPVLDGSLAGNEVIKHGNGYARAMGPMQFIPSTWAAWGSDANGDGKADPDNIFDATYSAGRYLCAGVTDIMAAPNRVNNVLRYNRSVPYANNVLAWAAAYAAGVMPTTPIPEMSAAPSDKDKNKKPKKDDKKKPGESTKPSTPESSTSPSTSKPKPKPNCLGPICLPPGLVPAPAPQQKPKPKAPAKPSASKPVPHR